MYNTCISKTSLQNVNLYEYMTFDDIFCLNMAMELDHNTYI